VNIRIPATSLWAQITGSHPELNFIRERLAGWCQGVDPSGQGRKVWVPGDKPGALYVLTGALLALWQLGWMPDEADVPPPAWTHSSLSEVQSLCMRLANAPSPDAPDFGFVPYFEDHEGNERHSICSVLCG